MNKEKSRSNMEVALEFFEDLSVEEQIDLIEQEIERRGSHLPFAEELLLQLKKKLRQLN